VKEGYISYFVDIFFLFFLIILITIVAFLKKKKAETGIKNFLHYGEGRLLKQKEGIGQRSNS
jgi:hypothetical protein